MNHDNAHCMDFKHDCPKECYRAELTRDLMNRADLIGCPVAWMHFKGTFECKKGENNEQKICD